MGNLGNCTWPNCGCDANNCKYDNPDAYAEKMKAAKVIVLDVVWVIAMPNNEGMLYSPPGRSAQEAWQNSTMFLTGMGRHWSREGLHKKGYRARRVSIQFEETSNG